MKFNEQIQKLRKEKGLTQNDLAEKLFISYQAVSQWETGNTKPDIELLPRLAEIFEVSIDELFGVERNEQKEECFGRIKNYDDDTLYIVVAKGKDINTVLNLNSTIKNKEDIEIEITGKALNVHSSFSVKIEGDVEGDVSAGDGVVCGNVGGTVAAGDGVVCEDVSGDVSAGDGVVCGEVRGSVTAGDGITCGNVGKNVTAGDGITCGNIGGSVTAGNEVSCGNIEGDASAGGDINCGNIDGDAEAGRDINCESVSGKMKAEGSINIK